MNNFLGKQVSLLRFFLNHDLVPKFLATSVLIIFGWIEAQNKLELSAFGMIIEALQVAIQRLCNALADVESHAVGLLVQVFGAFV